MGISSNKIVYDSCSMFAPENIENIEQAGSIYLVIHRPKCENQDEKSNKIGTGVEKTSHFAVAVDISGSSTTQQFVATHFDLNVTSSINHSTYIKTSFKRHDWNHYHLVKKVGQIASKELTRFNVPHVFAMDLIGRLGQNVYTPLIDINNGVHWSSILNCQTVTQLCIEHLGGRFPDDIEIITDIVPTMFDIYVNSSLITGQIRDHTNEISSC